MQIDLFESFFELDFIDQCITPEQFLQCYCQLLFNLEITDIVRVIGFRNVSTKSDVANSVIFFINPFSIPHIRRSIRSVGQVTWTDVIMSPGINFCSILYSMDLLLNKIYLCRCRRIRCHISMNMESLVAEIPINGLVHSGRLSLQVVGRYIHPFRIPNCYILLDEVKIAERVSYIKYWEFYQWLYHLRH